MLQNLNYLLKTPTFQGALTKKSKQENKHIPATANFNLKGCFAPDCKRSFIGRDEAVKSLSLQIIPEPIEKVLVLACGPYETWTMAARPTIPITATVVGVDLDPAIIQLNREFQKNKTLRLADAEQVINDIHDTVNLYASKPDTHYQKLFKDHHMDRLGIQQNTLFLKQIVPFPKIVIHNPTNAHCFVQQSSQSFNAIYAG